MADDAKPKEFTFRTPQFDPKHPYTDQTKHCWQSFVDYNRCVNAKGEDFPPCQQFYFTYRSLCPDFWIERWTDQVEKGNFPAKLD